MKVLSIDIETFSSVNLKKCGVYKYAESEDFEILLFGYAVDGGAVQVVSISIASLTSTISTPMPRSLISSLTWYSSQVLSDSPIPCRSLSVLPLCHRRTENLS